MRIYKVYRKHESRTLFSAEGLNWSWQIGCSNFFMDFQNVWIQI